MTTHTVKASDLSTMEWNAWKHFEEAAMGPPNAVNAQYAVAFALMSQSDTMATNCKLLNEVTSAIEGIAPALENISQALDNFESDGIANIKMGLHAVADAINAVAERIKPDDDLI